MGNRKAESLVFVMIAAALMLLCCGSAGARFRFQLDLTSSFEFSDNIYSAADNPVSDKIWSFSPTMTLSEVTGRGSTYITLNYSKRDYKKENSQDREIYTASLSLSRSLSRRTYFTVSEMFSYTPALNTQTTEFASVLTEAGIVSMPIVRPEIASLTNNVFEASFQHDLSRYTTLTLRGSSDISLYNSDAFDNSSETTGEAKLEYRPTSLDTIRLSVRRRLYKYGEDEDETTTDTFSASWDRPVTERFRSRVHMTYTDDNSKRKSAGFDTGSKSIQMKAGGTYDIDRNTRLTFNVGLVSGERTGRILGNQDKRGTGPIYDFSLTRDFKKSTLALNFRQTFSVGSGGGGFGTRFYGLDYEYRISSKATFLIGLSRSESSSGGDSTLVDSRTKNLYTNFKYQIDRNTYFNVMYSRVNQTSEGMSAGNVERNVIMVSIDFFDLNHRRP